MRSSTINSASKVSRTSSFNKKQEESKKAEIIAWIIFFGIGVTYFIATLILSI